ncbi:unnamed protein product [Moneuplotes crassus]|uniref:Methyltransferase type 11 domain-containing protein n=1 Tax=Euplotes crassus TaxID=5936 RepID=A0AAD1XPD1_EUPCR|nr:unnamed protein product [Moneuplotes crassus]
MLYSITQAKKFSKICEVGAGPGLGARMFIGNIMKKGAYYFCSDLSDEMMKAFYRNFQNCDSALNPRVKLKWIKDFETIDVNQQVGDMGEDIDKKLFLVKANNEKLPYPDGCFDLYISSLSLEHVDNYMNQLNESYRVLETGGVAGFTVPGRRENCNMLSLVPDVLESLGHEIPPPLHKHPTYLSDKETMEKDLRNVGFSIVKMYYTEGNIIIKNVTEVKDIIIKSPNMCRNLEKLTEEQKEEFFEELQKQWSLKYGPDTTEPLHQELLVIIATK